MTDGPTATGSTVVVVMGVSGSGKTTVARAVADQLDWDVGEGDDLHPRSNVEKMAAGVPLTDNDRWPWLMAVRAWIDRQIDRQIDEQIDERIDGQIAGRGAVIACSALRRSYRDVLRRPEVLFVLLDGDRETLLARLRARHGHFMPASLLDSQLATLERPDADERAVIVSITWDLEAQVAAIRAAIDA